MTNALGVNDHHNSTVINYMRFVRYQRHQKLRCIDSAFRESRESNLGDDTTYTVDEVSDLLDELLSVVRSDIETELINTGHTNVLLLRQLFQQAEKWHLKLQADISELENRELLEKIADLEQSEFSGASRDTDFSVFKSKLEPLNESSATGLLQMRINALEEENEKLKLRVAESGKQAVGATRKEGQMSAEIAQLQDALSKESSKEVGYSREEVEKLQRQISQLKLNGVVPSLADAGALEGDLVNTMQELLKTKEMLEMAEKELEKKVRQTVPFKNAMQMVQKKNDQVKELRRRLEKYEPTDE